MGTSRWAGRRRPAIVIAVALLIGFVALIARPVDAQETGGHPGGHGVVPPGAEGILPPGDYTPDQVAFARDLVRRTEQTVPVTYGTVTKLQQLGYVNFGATAPGGYDHWGIRALNDDEHILDPEYPESVVVQRLPNGQQEVVAVMFMLGSDDTMSTIPDDIAWLPGWHDHMGQLCVNDQGLFTGLPRPDGTCAVGHVPDSSPPMTHVWLRDPGCGHRFAEIGIMGVECSHGVPLPQPPFLPAPPFVPPGTWPPGYRPPNTPPPPPGAQPVPTPETGTESVLSATPHYAG